jgi:BNR repeat-like domain
VGRLKSAGTAGCVGIVVLGSALAAAAGTAPVTGTALGAQTSIVSGVVDLKNPATATFMQFPFAQSFPSPTGGLGPRVVLLSYSEHLDSGVVPELLVTQRSVDGGKTFTPLATAVPISSMSQLADGSLVAMDYRTTVVGSRVFQTTFWRSHDYGATWNQQNGTISAADSYDALFFHRGIVAGRDGSLLAAIYGYRTGDPKFRSMLARSSDDGVTWQIVSTIATSPAGATIEGRDEPTIIRASNGDLVAVMRQSAPINPAVCNGSRQGAGLVISRSSNDGATWTTPASLVGAGLNTYNVSSADPDLMMMPGGQLILSYGRPGNKILVSADGNGRTWSNLTSTMTGTSSGYTSIVPLSENSALQVGDLGSNWCFPAGSGVHTVGIWSKTVDIRPSDTNRIDLRTPYLNGSLKLVTNLTYQPSPAAGPAAAIDGSIDAASVAEGAASDGYYLMGLGSSTVLTGASVALPHAQASAVIDLSDDGRIWRSYASWYSSGQYRSLTARPFRAGTTARYVRVRLSNAGGFAALGEVQLRTDASTFEDDLVGTAPQGFTVLPAGTPMVVVASGGGGLNSDRAVHLNDTSSKAVAVMAIAEPQSTTRNLEFALRPNQITTGFVISLEGLHGATYRRALHVGVFPDGSLHRWTGSAWVNLTGAGLIKNGQWAGIRISATNSAASIYVNGNLVSQVPTAAGTTSLTGIQVSSGGTVTVGDDVFIDNFRAS